MSNTIAPSTVPLPAPSSAGPRSVMVSVPNAPQPVLSLPAGSTVEATVVTPPPPDQQAAPPSTLPSGSSTSGQTVSVSTPYGLLTLKTAHPLPEGAQLTLQMSGIKGDAAQLRMVTLDGKPILRGLQDALSAALPAASSTTTGTVSALSPLTNGLTTQAIVLSGPLPAGGGAMVLPAGSQMTIRVTGLPATLPSGGLLTAPLGGNGGSAASPLPGGANDGPGTSPAMNGPPGGSSAPLLSSSPPTPMGNSLLNSGKQALSSLFQNASASLKAAVGATAGAENTPTASTAAASPPAGTTSTVPIPDRSSPAGLTLVGTVAQQTAGGRTVLNTEAGQIALHARLSLPAGSAVTVDVVSYTPAPATQAAAQVLPPLSVPLFGGTTSPSAWPTLSDAVSLLQQSDPDAARQLLNSIPGTNGALLSNAISFTQASRTGNPGKWPGERVLSALDKAGERGRQLAAQLAEDMGSLAERAKRPAGNGGEWRALPMPFMDGNTIAQITVVTRRPQTAEDLPDKDSERERQDQGQRFLLDLSLSRLGDLQFDGLYKGKSRQFDLIIRTRDTLPAPIRQTIQTLFAQSSQALRLSGGVSFRVTSDFAGPTAGEVAQGGMGTRAANELETATVSALPSGGLTA